VAAGNRFIMSAYPPGREACKRLLEELTDLNAGHGTGYHARKYEIIHDLAEAKYYEARSVFVEGLQHPDPDYRWTCISALATHWQDDGPDVVTALMDMALHDPDVQVRMIAVDSLGYLGVRAAVPLLRRLMQDDGQDPDIVNTARDALDRLEAAPPD
jgi:HEAT repeat protein